MTIELLGKHVQEPGRVVTRTLDLPGCRLDAALSIGRLVPDGKENEDALTVIRSPRGAGDALVAVADAHFGRAASEIAVTLLREADAPIPWDTPRDPAGVSAALLALVEEVRLAVAASMTGSETTLVLVLLRDGHLHWVAVGDSFLYAFLPGEPPRLLNLVERTWLGSRFEGDLALNASVGHLPAEPGMAFLATTDGIPEAVRNQPTFSPEDIGHILATAPDHPLETLVDAAMQRAGEDNIGAVLIRIMYNAAFR